MRDLTELEAKKIARITIAIADRANTMMTNMLKKHIEINESFEMNEDLVISTVGSVLAFKIIEKYFLPDDIKILDLYE
jgi:hypothetical protein